jgi:hypothetical protein
MSQMQVTLIEVSVWIFYLISENCEISKTYGLSGEFIIIIIIITTQPLGQFGQEPKPSQATGMALVRCILSKG